MKNSVDEMHPFAEFCVYLVIFFCFWLVLFLGMAEAKDNEWRTSDTIRQAVVLSLLLADERQTEHIAINPDLYKEQGFARAFIGSKPSVGDVQRYFLTVAAIHSVAAYMLPQDWREGLQYITIGVQVDAINNNLQLFMGTNVNY